MNDVDELSMEDSEALPAERPPAIVVATGVVARGGALWLPVAGLLAWFGKKKAARSGLVAGAVAMPLGHLLSRVVGRRRPPAAGMPARRATPEHPHSPSFPSKHAVVAAAFGTAVAMEDRPAGAFVTPLVLLVAYSRLRTRVHWPTDVLGGLLFGALVAVTVSRRR
ncbi:phosphatase PAP2 family protein [Lentzea sp. NBRC 105346]|uniref:phosphatase PAP2 family protein n=1 Tax=Lentzea sp. NBRC 105346 TaxID=3032205 RepID=UPI0024A453F4|nr:phosphatase PAP2 family protein [Lentzea sp. NBRC 105346]GLZ29167.1 phosphatase PAP2 family protein [Lentzea sp. NBRC 105346]